MPLRKKGLTYTETKKFPITLKLISMIAVAVVVIGVIAFILIKKPAVLSGFIATPTPLGTVDNALLVQEVGSIFELPSDEEPTIATVTDPAQLANQPFFAKSQIGDIALVYQNARKAILYRPSLKKIIEVGVVNTESETSQISPTPDPSPLITPSPTVSE